jgi:Glycosyl transferase family 2
VAQKIREDRSNFRKTAIPFMKPRLVETMHESEAPIQEWHAFSTSPAVLRARERGEFIDCPVCTSREENYLFHDDAGRHVRCGGCGFVFVNPVPTEPPSAATLSNDLASRLPMKRALLVEEIKELLRRSIVAFARAKGRQPARVVLLGATIGEVVSSAQAGQLPAEVMALSDEETVSLLWHGEAVALQRSLADVDLLVLHELLDHSLRPDRVLQATLSALPHAAFVAVVYRDNSAPAARLLRRWWRGYAAGRTSFFSRNNVVALARRAGAWPRASFEVLTRQTLSTVLHRFSDRIGASPVLKAFDFLSFKAPLGRTVTLIEAQHPQREMLSIVVPVFNERRYIRQVLEGLLSVELPIEHELVIVESNSTDGTREIVKAFEGRPRVKLILEERARGKGHAVRNGLNAVRGTIILIQDADFEYDLEDYASLLRPILTHRAEFVLGSRTLGLGGWKVRRYSATPLKGWLMNLAQIIFAWTYNIFFGQKATDILTMFKVFRRDCLSRFELKSDGFELDIELACKLALAGFQPYEVPVNYRGRGWKEGKKIRFYHTPFHSYLMLLRCRFTRY